MKKIILLLAFATILHITIPARAAEEPPAYDGYLLCLRDETALLYAQLPDGIEPVVPEAGLYHAETLADAAYFPPESLRYIEPNYIVTLFSEEETDAQPWNLEMIGADTVQLAGLDGSGARIGVVDSGLYAEHEALAEARIISGRNYRNGSGDTSDSLGHGTFVTGIITAVAPGAEVVPLKCFEGKEGDIADIVAAMRGGVDQYGCNILNLSFGLVTDTQTLREAVAYAAKKGVIMVAAVGNSGSRTLNYPAAYDSVVGVGMVDQGKCVATGSQRNRSVFVTAPGSGVTGLAITGPSDYRTGGGTSFACPHVAAAAALLRQAAPDMTLKDFQAMLMNGGTEDLGDPGYDEDYGYGLLSLSATLLAPVREGEDLRLRVVACPGPEVPAQLWAAIYSGDGRMLGCCQLASDTVGDVLAGNGSLPFSDSTVWAKLFFLRDGALEPVQGAEESVLRIME